MRKFITIFFTVACSTAFAQWLPNGATTGNIYYNGGNVGIGPTVPQAKLHVNNGAIMVSDPSFNVINARIDGTSIPAIKFTRWTGGGGTLQHNAFVGQFNNASISGGEYSFGIGTGSSSSGDQNATSINMTMTLGGGVGIGTTAPQSKLHVSNGAIMASDPNFNAINVRVDGTSIPAIKFTRWTGGPGTLQHNAFVGQFYNTGISGGEYSFGIGTGSSGSGDQNAMSIGMTMTLGGNVGVGTTTPDAKLAVAGQVHAQEVKVSVAVPGPDYVFEKSYSLPTLEQVKSYIEANKHLPEVPSAKEMEQDGIKLSEMNMLLLKKVEELTLYVIELKKENDNLKSQSKSIDELRAEIELIKKQLK